MIQPNQIINEALWPFVKDCAVQEKATGRIGRVYDANPRFVFVEYPNEIEFMSGCTAYAKATVHNYLRHYRETP